MGELYEKGYQPVIDMNNNNNNNNNNNEERMLLSEGDKVLVDLISRGLTDDEITAELQIPTRQVLHSIARLLEKLGAQERLEIVFYAHTDRGMYKRKSTEVKTDFNLPIIRPAAS